MRKYKRTLLIWVVLILIVLLSCCTESGQESVAGDIYISPLYAQEAADLDIKSIAPNSDAERYQNPNALVQRVLKWGEYSWNLTYAFSDTVNYVDFDIDYYKVDGTEKYAFVTFKKDTDHHADRPWG